METILQDGEVLRELMEQVRERDTTLWEKIKQWFRNLAEDIRRMVDAYKGKAPDSYEGRAVASMKGCLEVLEGYYSDALSTAGENFRESGEQKNTILEEGERFSFRNSTTGMANDSLLPYDDNLKGIIENSNGIIVNSIDKLQEVVNIAFDEPAKKATAYFGIMNSALLEQIEKSVPNIPDNLNGKLFKTGRNYSITVSMDSIRHLTDSKNLTREDVLDYLDRVPDTIIENDSVHFDYYTDSRNNKLKGLLFKKAYSDGTMVSFEIISSRKMSLNLQTMYMDKASYQKKKSAKTPLVQNAPAHTPKARVSQTSTVSLSQPNVEVKEKLSTRDPLQEDAANALKKENEALKEDVTRLKELVKLQRQVTHGTVLDPSSVESAARKLKKTTDAKGKTEELTPLLNGLNLGTRTKNRWKQRFPAVFLSADHNVAQLWEGKEYVDRTGFWLRVVCRSCRHRRGDAADAGSPGNFKLR